MAATWKKSKKEKKWYCEECEKDIIVSSNFSHNKSKPYLESENFSRMNNILTDKKFKYLNPEVEQLDDLVNRTFYDCTPYFHRFK